MTDDFRRPYVDEGGAYRRVIYLTDDEARQRENIRRLRPGEVITPEVQGEAQIAPTPVTSVPETTGEAADTILGDIVAHPVPEVREREVP